jgi:DHA2 family multidrug resistance protein-like MFS transporter
MSHQPSTFDICWRMAICGIGFGFFQAPNLRAILSNAPPERGGGASGIVATSRLIGQASGAALVAFCLTVFGGHGEAVALGIAAAFAAIACIISLTRVFVSSRGGVINER